MNRIMGNVAKTFARIPYPRKPRTDVLLARTLERYQETMVSEWARAKGDIERADNDGSCNADPNCVGHWGHRGNCILPAGAAYPHDYIPRHLADGVASTNPAYVGTHSIAYQARRTHLPVEH